MKPGTKPKPISLKLIDGNRGKRPLNAKEARPVNSLIDEWLGAAMEPGVEWTVTQDRDR